jgi:hypothetical protein
VQAKSQRFVNVLPRVTALDERTILSNWALQTPDKGFNVSRDITAAVTAETSNSPEELSCLTIGFTACRALLTSSDGAPPCTVPNLLQTRTLSSNSGGATQCSLIPTTTTRQVDSLLVTPTEYKEDCYE